MQVKTQLKYLRIAPRKVRLVTNLIKGLSVNQAESQLKFLTKRAAGPIWKLLKSAVANANHNFHLNKDDLYIYKITVDTGPMLKRWLPRAMGRATPIQKKTSHITLVLESKAAVKKEVKPRRLKIEKPVEPGIPPVAPPAGEAAGEKEAPLQPATFKLRRFGKTEKSGPAKRTLGFRRRIFRRKAV
jgi:large subunit ribosomal protein L22